jgi:hypothetical protein
MNQILVQKRICKSVILTCLLLFLRTSFVLAAEDITGEWEITTDFNGQEIFATLSISRKVDGSLIGKWGPRELIDVRFEHGKLTFTRTYKFRVRNSRDEHTYRDEYTLTLKDGKLTGTVSTDVGDSPANMTRKKPKSPVLGQWDIKFNVGEREIAGRLTISENPDGMLAGKWEAEFGEHVISNVKFQDGKLIYTRKSKLGEREWESNFEGIIKGHKLFGAFKSQRGDLPATGERIGAPLVGKWELTNIYSGGTSTIILKINGDLTGRYEFPGGEQIPIKKLKLEGDQVTFVLEMIGKDRPLRLDFKGKLDGKTLRGKLSYGRFTSEVTGKKIETASPLFGTWEFTRETSRGTRTSTLKIKEDVTGTYTYRDNETAITDLKVDGDQVSFKVTMRWQDREYPMEFKGKVDGTTLKGEFTTSRGTREATGKKID